MLYHIYYLPGYVFSKNNKIMFHLSFTEKTHIVTPPQDTRVVLGHVATLSCGVQHADGVNARVVWRHDGAVVAGTGFQDGLSRITMLGDGSLQIQEARAADVGLYTCTVRIMMGRNMGFGNVMIANKLKWGIEV